ncbi:MAG: OmpA family protein [Pseudomonadota bacterium]
MLGFWRLASVWSVFWCIASGATAQVYKAELATSEWLPVSAKSLCSLSHNIPGFGKAVFMQTLGKRENFYIESQQRAFPIGEVNIETLPPVWRADLESVKIGKVKAVAGNQPINMDTKQINLALAQLNRGNSIVFFSQSRTVSDKSYLAANGVVRLIVEAKNFAAAYKMYQQCKGEYVAPTAENSGKNADISKMQNYIRRDSNIYGSTTSKHQGPQTETAKMIDYVARDVAIYGATIKGDTKSNNSWLKAPVFAADIMNADWTSTSNPFACNITHVIPGFGKANLAHRAGNEEVFYIESQNKIIFPVGPVRIETLAPAWRSAVMPQNLGTVIAVAGAQPIRLLKNNIAQVVTQLSSGVKVMFTSSPMMTKPNTYVSTGESGVIRVVLETRNFLSAYKNYQQCVGELINYTFSHVARILINYPEKPQGLSAATKLELTKVARYMKADQTVLRVLIDAHSDNAEATKINEAISKQYAEWVSAYLVEQGIAVSKIASRWHGEKFPIATNKTVSGRAQNRRVTLRLETALTRQENEKNAAARKAAIEAKKLNPEKEKMTPEDIDKIVEGLDLIPQQ